jgi:type II secretory pathway component PulC
MSDADRRLRVIALGFAAVAMVVAIAAAVMVVRRDDTRSDAHGSGAQGPIVQVSDHTVAASEVVKLSRNAVETVVENGTVKGVKLKDAALAKSLGLEPGDVIAAISGRPITREMDLYDVMFNVSMMNATTLYVEVVRARGPMLLRWRLDGDLKQARYANNGSPLSSLYSAPADPDPDPLLDTIEKVDDTHVKVPKATVNKLMADPMAYSKGARVVPAIKYGVPSGLKLYAIRPGSLYARFGFMNGDTISAINGENLTSADKALELYTKLRSATELSFNVVRRGQPLQLTITITK